MTDISDTLAPNSDQLDAVDLRGRAPQVFTVTRVDVRPSAEQPVSVHLAEFPRVWRPGKSMRRVLAFCWGSDSAHWTGRQVELYCDDSVKFGPDAIGGTRISRLSHIDGPKKVPLIITRGKSGMYDVKPLPATPAGQQAPPAPNADLLAQIKTAAEAAGVDLATIAKDWAESHDGQPIKEATDLDGLELLRDDLQGRAS